MIKKKQQPSKKQKKSNKALEGNGKIREVLYWKNLKK